MKAIMISIKPKYVAKILNGEKTIEVRKTMPKCDLPIDVYIYCTKDKEYRLCKGYRYFEEFNKGSATFPNLNGKVVAKFTLNKVEHFEYDTCSRDISCYWLDNGELLKDKGICLTGNELWDYIKSGDGYAWYIANLEIFDKPKELSGFRKLGKKCKYQGRDTYCDYCSYCDCIGDELTKAPQSWCRVEVEEDE